MRRTRLESSSKGMQSESLPVLDSPFLEQVDEVLREERAFLLEIGNL